VAGDDEAVAGVVAFAAENRDGPIDAEPLQDIDAAAAGVFHEHKAGDAVIVGCSAVEFAALVAGKLRSCHTSRVFSFAAGRNRPVKGS
jgi:hypothetical protein